MGTQLQSDLKGVCVLTLTIIMALVAVNKLVATVNAREIGWQASGNGGAVAAGHPDSVAAGISILEKGGNAADAAAATILALAVTDYGLFAIGGEVPILVYDSKSNQVKSISGIGGAPRNPDAIKWFYENGIPSKGSMKAAPTPSALDAIITLLSVYGTVSLSDAVSPTLELLDRGKAQWHPNLAITLRKLLETEAKTVGTREQKLQAARDRFYRGDIADELEAWYIATGAWIRKQDLESHITRIEDPVVNDYLGYTVCKCGPWTQGPAIQKLGENLLI